MSKSTHAFLVKKAEVFLNRHWQKKVKEV